MQISTLLFIGDGCFHIFQVLEPGASSEEIWKEGSFVGGFGQKLQVEVYSSRRSCLY